MINKESREVIREKKHLKMKHLKIRNRFSGTTERPRLAVYRSNNHIYAQIIDDTVGKTLVAASTLEKSAKDAVEKTNDVAAASYGIKQVVFDRGGFIYQGKIKALADAAREAGLEF